MSVSFLIFFCLPTSPKKQDSSYPCPTIPPYPNNSFRLEELPLMCQDSASMHLLMLLLISFSSWCIDRAYQPHNNAEPLLRETWPVWPVCLPHANWDSSLNHPWPARGAYGGVLWHRLSRIQTDGCLELRQKLHSYSNWSRYVFFWKLWPGVSVYV